MRILVAGASGFAGTKLVQELKKRGHTVFSADLNNAEYSFDLADKSSIDTLLTSALPDVIILLAGISNVSVSWEHPADTFDVNVKGALSFFESHLAIVPDARFIFAGSAEEYGRGCSDGRPFKEDDTCFPANPYALSKFSAAQAMKMLSAKHKSSFVHLRLANHYGPGQRKGFVTADFSSQVAQKTLNSDNSAIKVGNLEAQKDFLYIDDVIEAYILIAEAENLKFNTYNIGSGNPAAVKSIMETLLKISGTSAKVVVDPAKFRSADTNIMSLDISRIKSELNWSPRISLEEGLSRTLQYWLKQQK